MFSKLLLLSVMLISLNFAEYEAALRDICYFKGIKRNTVSGYGLIAGLSGTGDSRSALTRKTVNQFLTHSGIEADENSLQTKNAAVVAVTAELNGFTEKGDIIDVSVASIGDAKSLDNGILLNTVLRGSDGNVYVVAGGVVSCGAVKSDSRRGSVAGGGTVERRAGESQAYLGQNGFTLVLKEPSVDSISTIREEIEANFGMFKSEIVDYKSIRITSATAEPVAYKDIVELLALKVKLTSRARVVIDKQTGIVVVGDQVRIDTAYVSLPGLSVAVKGDKTGKQLGGVIKNNNTVSELATEFANLGVKPADVLAIFMALKKCGALNADIVVQ